VAAAAAEAPPVTLAIVDALASDVAEPSTLLTGIPLNQSNFGIY